MSLWPEGYYQTDGLVAAEFTEIKDKDCCKLTFAMTGSTDQKAVLLFFTGGAGPISHKILAQLGWNQNPDKPEFATPRAIEQLRCEHYNHPTKGMIESWKTAMGSKPLDNDRKRRLVSDFRAHTSTPAAPAGRPTAPPAARSGPPPANTVAPAAAPRSAPPAAAPASTPPADPPVNYKEKAWLVWDKAAADAGKQPDVQKWQETIRGIMVKTNKPEDKFGRDEWKAVADAAPKVVPTNPPIEESDIPF